MIIQFQAGCLFFFFPVLNTPPRCDSDVPILVIGTKHDLESQRGTLPGKCSKYQNLNFHGIFTEHLKFKKKLTFVYF